jgi:hypothetical protein
MDTLRRGTGRTICLLLLPLLSFAWFGCSHSGSARSRNESGRPIPFRDEDQTAAPDAVEASSSSSPVDAPSQGGDVPFRDAESWPAGTLITVRLSNPVFSDTATGNGSISGGAAAGNFEAVVDEPVVIEGVTVVPRGTSAAGRIESFQSSLEKPLGLDKPSAPERFSSSTEKIPSEKHDGVRDKRGYIRLTLDSVDVAGRSLSIRTSSLFARVSSYPHPTHPGSGIISLEQGRRLTFRLSEPVYVATQPIISSR